MNETPKNEKTLGNRIACLLEVSQEIEMKVERLEVVLFGANPVSSGDGTNEGNIPNLNDFAISSENTLEQVHKRLIRILERIG